MKKKHKKKHTYKGKKYIYGIKLRRDYPVRGKQSFMFYIKIKLGVVPFNFYKTIYSELKNPKFNYFSANALPETIIKVEKEIDNYILKSRKRKLNKLNNVKNLIFLIFLF